MKERDYFLLRNKYRSEISDDDRICKNCEHFNPHITDNTMFENFGMCEYYLQCVYNINVEEELILTKPDRYCYINDFIDETADAFKATYALLDKYADSEAQDETEKWLNAHYYE